MSNQGVSNIAEILGQKKLKVIWRDEDYFIRTMDSLSPEDFGRVMAYGKNLSTLTDEDIKVDNGVRVVKAIDDVIAIIGPDFPRHKVSFKEKAQAFLRKRYIRKFDLSLDDCVLILQFWTENSSKKKLVKTVMKPKRKRR